MLRDQALAYLSFKKYTQRAFFRVQELLLSDIRTLRENGRVWRSGMSEIHFLLAL
jgi:hypothetical protein